MGADASEILWRLHRGLPRQAPGSDATTRAMIAAADMGDRPVALDIGCGPGRASVLLAVEARATVTAVDLHEPFLDELRDRAAAAGVAHRVRTEVADMADLPYAPASFDLLWSEGAIYILGFTDALSAWGRLLRPSGRLVVTECVWTTGDASPNARRFWDEAYPAMRRAEDNVDLAAEHGWAVDAWWLLPDSDWWDEYYGPLSERLEALGADERRLAEPLDREIALRRHHAGEYGYAAYVLRRMGADR